MSKFVDALEACVREAAARVAATSHVWHVRTLFWRNAVIAPWQQGDLIVLDNRRVAHARMPFATQGARKLWVAWSAD